MIYLKLFFEFLKIGLFSVGGGMATLPFLQRMSENTGWFPSALITDMVAISESTPGPIGINMATYVGYQVGGLLGGIVASLGIVVPAVVIVCLVSRGLEKFRQNRLVDSAFYGLRPAVTGLIGAAGIGVLKVAVLRWELFKQTAQLANLFDIKKLIFFALFYFAITRFKRHPIFYIACAAVVGLVMRF